MIGQNYEEKLCIYQKYMYQSTYVVLILPINMALGMLTPIYSDYVTRPFSTTTKKNGKKRSGNVKLFGDYDADGKLLLCLNLNIWNRHSQQIEEPLFL